MKLFEVIKRIEAFAPPSIAQFDYVGFLLKTVNKDIHKIGLTLDPTLKTIQNSIDSNCDLLITHHGPDDGAFNPHSYLDQKRIALAKAYNLPIYRFHLNLDFCSGGNSETLCKLLGFPNPIASPITYKEFTLPVGMHTITGEFTLEDLLSRVKKLHPSSLRVIPSSKNLFKKIAVSPGEGFKSEFFEQIKDLDCYISGELNHIAIVRAQDLDICLIEATHASTENEPLKIIRKTLEEYLLIPILFLESQDNIQVIRLN